MQKFLREEDFRKLQENHAKAGEGENELEMEVVVRLFTPDAAATWHLVSGEERCDDFILFGLCDLGVGFPEYGSVSLAEIASVRGHLNLPVERDRYYQPKTLREEGRSAGV